jgi:archaellum biogenesis ATPase FlaH
LENLNLVSKSNFDQAQEQKKQVLLLLNSTDEALQQLATLFNSVNEINTKEKHRDQLEQSMQQIRELADRAKIYSKH